MKRMAEALGESVFDLLILGGGITGAGVALDAALRGFRVALIDKSDFASGTSSVSSKLVHGGLRYLEHGDFRLVYEALHERRRLLHNAPHLVRPLRFVIPFFDGARVPPWQWRVGLTLYDLLAGQGNIQRSRPLRLRELERSFPQMTPANLRGGAEYFDAQMDDARLCIDVLKSAAAKGAFLSNYVEALAFEMRGSEIGGVRVIDKIAGKEYVIRAGQVLNATGPWVDHIRRLAGVAEGPLLQPSKGAHIIARNPGFSAAFLLLHPQDGRVLFVIPWLEGNLTDKSADPPRTKMLIGTTDTGATDGPDQLHVTPQDVEYLLAAYNHFFTPALGSGDILGSFAGLRPLIRSRANQPSSQSREFLIEAAPNGLLSVAGGKYTTYRHMAEVITDRIAARLGRRRGSITHEYRLDGAPRAPWDAYRAAEPARIAGRFDLSPAAANHLVSRYGRRAADVAAYRLRHPAADAPVVPDEPDLRFEFDYHRDEEMALFSEDFLLRRTRLGLVHPELLAGTPSQSIGLPVR